MKELEDKLFRILCIQLSRCGRFLGPPKYCWCIPRAYMVSDL